MDRLRAAPRCVILARMISETLLDKVWRAHTVRTLPSGQAPLFFGLHRKMGRLLLTLNRTAKP